jgi:hypothetical protein
MLPYEHWICQVHYRYQSGYGKKGYKKDTNVKQNRIRHEKHLIKWIYGFELHF